jgi:hypothetical protein
MAALMAQFNKNTHQYSGDNKTLFETVMLADQYGNNIGPANPSGVAVDAFGRSRVSTPLTLFDSSHRFGDNELWATANTAGGTYSFSANEGLVNLNVNTASGAEVVRETTKVFSYQPGKSLLNLNTFVMAPAKTGLRQRVGYYGEQNGMYLELDGSTLSFVERTSTGGSLQETRVAKANWNLDPLDGTGPSLQTLDITKAQIMWMDIEWLGLGSVRMGFIINGEIIHCHSFHHANIISTTYITTASLPLRYEITNTSSTSGSSTFKQVCSTVISEGGYELRGLQGAAGTLITSAKTLATAGTFYPVVSIRLKSTHLDAIVIPTAASFLGSGNGINYNWKIIVGATITTGSWTSAGDNSAVEYTLAGTAMTGGRTLGSGYLNSSNQGSPALDILKQALFQFQLARNSLTSTPETFTLAVAADTNTQSCYGSLDWEEVTR